MEAQNEDLEQVAAEIGRIPADWHTAGSLDVVVLRAILKHVGNRQVSHSLETGSGKSTLLFSHLSQDHVVFALELHGKWRNNSITGVRESPLFKSESVTFIEGPTQLTLPRYEFKHQVQIALLDGPHGYPFPDLEYYYVYPQLEQDALLVVDDIHVPTIRNLFEFLQDDEMFRLVEIVENAAFFRRTSAPTFDPLMDGWWLQKYNKQRFPIMTHARPRSLSQRITRAIPALAKKVI
jgi:hypothetical protein